MSSLSRILTLGVNTVREAVRNKLLYALLFFAILMIASSVLLATLSYVESDRILQDIGIAAIRLFGVAIAIFVGVGLIHREVDRRTVYTILSKPITRAEFLLGKYVGLVMTIWMQMAVMVFFFALVSRGAEAPITGGHVAAFTLIAVELALVTAIATLFSAFTSPLLASFFSCGIWFVGHLTRDLRDLGASSSLESVQQLTSAMYRVLPDLDGFDLTIEAAHGLPIVASDVWLAVVYGVGYAAVVLCVAVFLFERRDFR